MERSKPDESDDILVCLAYLKQYIQLAIGVISSTTRPEIGMMIRAKDLMDQVAHRCVPKEARPSYWKDVPRGD